MDKHSVLSFDDICVDIQGKRILHDVSGAVDKGEILAIMGPSGEYVYGYFSNECSIHIFVFLLF